MSPNSSASSLQAQNGSAASASATAYSDTAHSSEVMYSSNIYAASATQAHNPHRQRPVHSVTSTSAYQYTNGTYTNDSTRNYQTNGYTSPSIVTHHEQPSSQQTTSSDATSQSHQSYGTYYLPPYSHEAFSYQTTRYANELTFDEEQSTAPAVGSYYMGQTTDSTPSYSTNYGNIPTPAHDTTGPGTEMNGSYSPTTRRWSAEYSSEERLRLGLPRYETEEQQRQAYERATGQYDSTRRH